MCTHVQGCSGVNSSDVCCVSVFISLQLVLLSIIYMYLSVQVFILGGGVVGATAFFLNICKITRKHDKTGIVLTLKIHVSFHLFFTFSEQHTMYGCNIVHVFVWYNYKFVKCMQLELLL